MTATHPERELSPLEAEIQAALHHLQADGAIDRGRLADLLRRCAVTASEPPADNKAPVPFTYAYKYHGTFGGFTYRVNGGEEVNGGRPIEAIPLYTAEQLATALSAQAAEIAEAEDMAIADQKIIANLTAEVTKQAARLAAAEARIATMREDSWREISDADRQIGPSFFGGKWHYTAMGWEWHEHNAFWSAGKQAFCDTWSGKTIDLDWRRPLPTPAPLPEDAIRTTEAARVGETPEGGGE